MGERTGGGPRERGVEPARPKALVRVQDESSPPADVSKTRMVY